MDPLILIIEDDIDSGFIFSEALRSAGLKSEVVTDGAAAEQRLTEVVPDLVLLDLHLPLVGGIKLLHQIRHDERLRQTKVIVVTANDHLTDLVERDADDVLIKPVAIKHLCRVVNQFLPE